MTKKSIIPFGPNHPVLPEPIHIDLEVQDEIVVGAKANFGFVHRGLEALCTERDYQDYVAIAERTCGICSFMHGMGYCDSVENMMQLEIPERANYLRCIWAELSRIHSHLLWLGLLADAFGFESLHNHSWRLRDKVLDIFQMTTGGRIIFSVCKIGGVKRDMSSEQLRFIEKTLAELKVDMKGIQAVFLQDRLVRTRLDGQAHMSKEMAIDFGTVGPFMRASGVNWDMRQTGYAIYDQLDFEPVVRTGGDSYARVDCRIEEISQSCDLISQMIRQMPEGDIDLKQIKGNPKGEWMTRFEQPRGEAIYYTMGVGKKNLARMRIRTPTIANLPAICECLKGTPAADVMVAILTIDPCISCVDR